MTEGANPTTPLGSREIAARPVFRGAIRDLDALAAAVAAVGENPLLLHPETRMPAVDFWKAYAGRLKERFERTVARAGDNPAPLQNPLYTFIVQVVPGLTGEHVTFHAVRTHYARQRPVRWTAKRL